jgi:hypothetical protein
MNGSSASTWQTTGWTVLLFAAVLWPARVLSPLDGIPLDGPLEAVVIGIVLPALWWLDRRFLVRPIARAAIISLLFVKLASAYSLPQHGLCARFSTSAPFNGVSSTIPIDEPTGSLRSWDVRADWAAATPVCTAILDRPYRARSEFPAWFLNLLATIRPDWRDLELDVSGYVTVRESGNLVLETGSDMSVAGRVGGVSVASQRDAPIVVPLAAGVHGIELHAVVSGEHWRLVPLWNGHDAWSPWRSIGMTLSMPSLIDQVASGPVALVTTALVLFIVVAWFVSALGVLGLAGSTGTDARNWWMNAWAIGWTAAMSVLFAWVGLHARFERGAALLLVGAAFLPVAPRQRTVQRAFVLIGLPWLAMFVGHSWDQIGRFTAYSLDDDWHVYESAAYRIFLHGYWLEGGTETFYHQPLYRWIAGALHVVFGDSSVGHTYWDAACLLSGALLTFWIVKRVAGFRWAIVAAAMTLATFTLGTIWYLIGRGLAEITALGWISLAAVFLLRARLGRASAALIAGAFAVLMFYTRLNHLLFAGSLLVLLVPVRTPARWRSAWQALRRANVKSAAIYALTIAAGIVLFAARTWWYTGRFSVLYGTAFWVQQTGLRVTTIGSPTVWAHVAESLRSLVWMNDPPSPDVRATLVILGVMLSLFALAQVPYVRRLPLSVAVLTMGAVAGSFFAHTHDYPGRMSVHLVPMATAMTACAAARLARVKAQSRHAVHDMAQRQSDPAKMRAPAGI